VSRRYNLRRVKSRYSYSADELTRVLDVHIGTIRKWVMQGLRPFDRRRPQLFLGEHVISFLGTRAQPRCVLQPGELYCLSCKTARPPSHGILTLVRRSAATFDFVAPCAACGTRMFRRVREGDLGARAGECTIASEDDAITMNSSGDSPDTRASLEIAA
jgi:hypothetical protein